MWLMEQNTQPNGILKFTASLILSFTNPRPVVKKTITPPGKPTIHLAPALPKVVWQIRVSLNEFSA
jgi:hypothetical protein